MISSFLFICLVFHCSGGFFPFFFFFFFFFVLFYFILCDSHALFFILFSFSFALRHSFLYHQVDIFIYYHFLCGFTQLFWVIFFIALLFCCCFSVAVFFSSMSFFFFLFVSSMFWGFLGSRQVFLKNFLLVNTSEGREVHRRNYMKHLRKQIRKIETIKYDDSFPFWSDKPKPL